MAEEKRAYTGKVEFPVDVTIGKGLEGAITNMTQIGYVDGQKGWLCYRGITIEQLAEHSSYEETAYLLVYGKLPSQNELEDFKKKLKSYRKIPSEIIDMLKSLPKTAHPMTALLTGISMLGGFDEKACVRPVNMDNEYEIATKLISQIATISGAIARIRKGEEPVEPDDSLDHTANFLYMCNGEKPDELMEKVMDISLILHADHGMNNSTFTTMVITSTESDLYSSIAGGIGSLKGPLHGGANEQVLYTLEEIGAPDNVEKWYEKARAEKRKIMGFGHRVYKAYDPRARILAKFAEEISQRGGLEDLCKTAVSLEKAVIRELGEQKGVFPNVDFYSGIIYRGLGIETPLFTIIFAVSRIAGWVARVLEYLPENRIFRPRAVYVGSLEETYVPMEKR